MPEILWNTQIIKEEAEHMQALWVVGEKVQDSPIFLNVGLWVGFQSMNHIREFHSITNEKDREVISHQIKVSLHQRVRAAGPQCVRS